MLPWRRRCRCGHWELSSLPSVSVWPPRCPESRRPLISDREVPETWDGPPDCFWHCLWNFPWHQQPAFVVRLQKLRAGLQLTLRLTFSNLNQWKVKHRSPHKSFAFAAPRPLPACHSTVIWSLVWGGVAVPRSWMTHFFVTLNYPCFYNSSQRPGESGLWPLKAFLSHPISTALGRRRELCRARVAPGDDSISSGFWIMSKHAGNDAFLGVASFRVFIIWWNQLLNINPRLPVFATVPCGGFRGTSIQIGALGL